MVIVAGHLLVDPEKRESYLAEGAQVVEQARRERGCLDFTIKADLADGGRINIFERWESRDAVEAFRGSGISDEQSAAILSASVAEYDVTAYEPWPKAAHLCVSASGSLTGASDQDSRSDPGAHRSNVGPTNHERTADGTQRNRWIQ